jgi:hypothetical protein
MDEYIMKAEQKFFSECDTRTSKFVIIHPYSGGC